MRLVVETWFAGVEPSDGSPYEPETNTVVDADSGVVFAHFRSRKEAESYLEANRAELAARPLPVFEEWETRHAAQELEVVEVNMECPEAEEYRLLNEFLERCERRSWETRLQDEGLRRRWQALRARAALRSATK